MSEILLEKLGKTIADVKDEPIDKEDSALTSGIFLFFSFDLSNSTIFKIEHPSLWANVFTQFYQEVLTSLGVEDYKNPKSPESMESKSDDSKVTRMLWKLIGDEVLIYAQIYEVEQLYSQVIDVYIALNGMMERIAESVSEKCLKPVCSMEHCQDIKKVINSILGIKTTMWIAECVKGKEEISPNIIYIPDIPSPNGVRIDFLGRDVDEGFRIAKYAVKNKIIMSPLLAWLIWKSAKNDDDKKKIVNANLKITAYVQLKGVWRNRKVPIVMFHQNFKQFETILDYDELDVETYSNIKEVGIEKFISDSRFAVSKIDLILRNISRYDESVELLKKLYESYTRLIEIKNKQSIEIKNKQHELHIACVLFTKNNKVLLREDKVRGLEFGCITNIFNGQLNTWKEVCEKGYLKKYDLKIEVDELPRPVATYSYEKDGKHHAYGLIVIAKFVGENIEENKDWKEYEINDINIFNEKKKVDDFSKNLKRAIQIFQEKDETDVE